MAKPDINASMSYYLSTAFDYEIRNRIDIDLARLQSIDELSEEESDEFKILDTVKEYLLRRKGEMKP